MDDNRNNRSGQGEEDDSKPPAVTTTVPAERSTVDESNNMVTAAGGVANSQTSSVKAVDDDDDDNWSRQVETDETTGAITDDPFRSMRSNPDTANSATSHENAILTSTDEEQRPVPLPPPELTMKEKLVLRERQRRIETQRARLKRQFALSNDIQEDSDGEGESSAMPPASVGEGTLGEESTKAHPDEDSPANNEGLGFNMERFLRNNTDGFNPQLETAMEEEEARPEQHNEPKGVVMERFLNDPVVVPSVIEQDAPPPSNNAIPEPVDELPNRNSTTEAHRSVSFDMDGTANIQDDTPVAPALNDIPYATNTASSLVSNASIQAEPDEEQNAVVDIVDTDPLTATDVNDLTSNNGDQNDDTDDGNEPTRVLRLTEADMQEMAAIEEASIGNAPPSEREEETLSEIGELADFGPRDTVDHTAISQDTPTTAMESSSQISDRGSTMNSQTNLMHPNAAASVDGGSVASSNQLLLSPGAVSNHSVAANPPSVVARDDVEDNTESMMGGTDTIVISETPRVLQPMLMGNESNSAEPGTPDISNLRGVREFPVSATNGIGPQDDLIVGGGDNRIVNRTLRPGFGGQSLHLHTTPDQTNHQSSAVASGGGDHAGSSARENSSPVLVEGFDFNKDSPTRSPFHGRNQEMNESLRDLPPDSWSPSGTKMSVSPLQQRREVVSATNAQGGISHQRFHDNHQHQYSQQQQQHQYNHNHYGSINDNNNNNLTDRMLQRKLSPPNLRNQNHETARSREHSDETMPLLRDIPPEIVTHLSRQGSALQNSKRFKSDGDFTEVKHEDLSRWGQLTHRLSVQTAVQSAFSEVRSQEEDEKQEIHNESEHYLKSSMFTRAFPERQLALIVTLIFEIPVLLMITGGSDALCQLIGRTRYQLLVGFIPLASAISGNVGLQASTLTTRAISHDHVTAKSYMPWFITEVGAAAFLGMGMGLLLGTIAYIASGYDFPFGLTIAIAQLISIVTAGVTGTFAPLLFSFIFKRDSGKWGGPLETAIQDIVGSFAMVIISYRILLFLGAGSVDPNDVCFSADTER